VKFVCGRLEPGTGRAAPGTYFTAINLLNHGAEPTRIQTQIATTESEPAPGSTLAGPQAELKPNQAVEIDCEDISHALRRRRFEKGFLVVKSQEPLAVTAVYTASNERDVSSIDVEQISGVPSQQACPDLVIVPDGRPEPDLVADRTRIPTAVRNIGTASAPETRARVEDPNRPGDPLRIAEAPVGPLSPGQQANVTLELKYAITGSSNLAALVLQVDPKDLIPECREDNNTHTVGATP
jgi:hypothetical protein